ncbi:AT-rich interactive domain-containing protein 2 [Ricinus communis]|uniref:DNA binding protein, putative n=1 Tax=Ricinus communis TaxID=3988 RepID=B9RCE7_RICCO|nr:AT-rich interactive domain-containing protein 2 [Ricinus communis]XP_015571454.1 AT-rich interactive domain-containing protein 2 [Ricinus communis]XP_025015775.1 AT-rich interactive domain-containing protein 2 [Ricinus communis]XP_048229929.1 AT-rich interactive domain-containing protein 2 [Ricinus communis]EEF51218.1 DNA binding protein, putative [Ricinus communis]|eukprot:XP_015571452.1 AT-rich interactive domain-containing protein 2 [Ricinus communis]
MAGWSMLTNGSSLDCADVTSGFKDSTCRPDVNHAVKDHNAVEESDDDHEVKLRCLFDQVLSVFANEAAARGSFRPIPALLGGGKSLDLFKLFRVVRKRGGFDLVNGFWSFVVKELGLDLAASASVKLVYFKYLYELERWLRGSNSSRRLGNGQCRPGGKFNCLSMELEAEFRKLLSNGSKKGKDGKYKKKSKNFGINVVKSKIGLPDTKDVHSAGSRHTDDDENFQEYTGKCKGKSADICAHPPPTPALAEEHLVRRVKPYNEKCSTDNDGDDVVILDPSIGEKLFSPRKRKRESLSRMLNWVIQAAKSPDHPSIGNIPPLSKCKDNKGNELWAQAIRARDALVRRRQVNSGCERSLLQNHQKIHPSMYKDAIPPSDPSSERVRCSERLPALVKPRSCSCCNSCSAPKSQLISPPKTELENAPKAKVLMAEDLSAATATLSSSGDIHIHRHVSVGRRFQAEVPEWTGLVSESESKWLGTQAWPLEFGEHNAMVQEDTIGKGRPESCGCELPGSVECVRFHIAENRIKLKIELGSVFYHWKFDCMGEEIALRWTAEEEKRFKDVVRFNLPSLDKFFWDNSRKYFRRKTKEELVSYYFNVFLVQRRSYQNRVTPKHIDSDDDESEFGSLSDTYGQQAVTVPGTKMLMCSENKQCTDFK